MVLPLMHSILFNFNAFEYVTSSHHFIIPCGEDLLVGIELIVELVMKSGLFVTHGDRWLKLVSLKDLNEPWVMHISNSGA